MPVTLLKTPFNAAEVLQEFTKEASGAGAIVSFTGLVRATSTAGERITELHLQAYPPLTETSIERAVQKAQTLWTLDAVTVLHRIGDMVPDEAIVFVAAAAKHRRDAFEGVDYLMDYLKTEAIFWKKEAYADGAAWIEPRGQDYTDKARWAHTSSKLELS